MTNLFDDDRDPNYGRRVRVGPGAPLRFETPEIMAEAVNRYFEWCEENPLIELKAFGTGVTVKLPKPRPFTIKGMCVFLGISRQTWADYKGREAFKGVMERVENVIYTQKFEGAVAGLMNHSIIVRELGLADRKTVEIEDPKVLTQEEQDAKLEQQIPFLIPMMRRLGYSVEKIEDD